MEDNKQEQKISSLREQFQSDDWQDHVREIRLKNAKERAKKSTLVGKKTMIIISDEDGNKEVWTTITKICDHYPEFKYGYLKQQTFPFTYRRLLFEKVPVGERLINDYRQ